MRNTTQFVSGSIAAAGFVAVTQIVTRDNLSGSLKLAVLFFSVSIPTLGIFSFIEEPHDKSSWYAIAFTSLNSLALVGLTALFWHFGWIYCLLFLGSSAASLFLYVRAHIRSKPNATPPKSSETKPPAT